DALRRGSVLPGARAAVLRGVARRPARLDEGLHAPEGVVHEAFRIRAESARAGVANRTADRVVRGLDLDRTRAVGIRVEVDSARVLHERAFLRAPCEHAILLARRDDGVELELRAGRPADGPAPALVITAGLDAPHAVNLRHELREALEIL